uniref:Uncharacterized protein n=1 Tax=Brassica oleracea TaxID=3712 RepID=A0A3P6C8V1_BRAOL|nr:unnamed protein product [Brassica oleracea]
MVKDFGMVLIYPFIIKPKICNLTLGKRERGQPTHGLSPALSKLSWSRIHHRRLYRWREDAVARGVGVVGLSYGQLRSVSGDEAYAGSVDAGFISEGWRLRQFHASSVKFRDVKQAGLVGQK